MDWHLGPVKASTVVMAEVVSFVHEVHLIHNGHRISEIILRTFWVTESVLDPCGDCVDGIHAEKRNQHQDRPDVVREIPQEIESARSIVAHRVTSVVGSAVLSMVETHMSRPTQFRNVPIEVSQEEFEVAAEDFIAFLRKVALAPVCLKVAGAEHPHKPLELETVKRKVESDRHEQPRFP